MDYHRKKYGCTVEELEQYQATSNVQPIGRTDGRNSNNFKDRVLSLNDTMPFGKYKGRRIESLIISDLNYMIWFSKLENITLSNDANELIDEAIEMLKG